MDIFGGVGKGAAENKSLAISHSLFQLGLVKGIFLEAGKKYLYHGWSNQKLGILVTPEIQALM